VSTGIPAPPVHELVAALLEASPELDPAGQRLAVAVYRTLAQGDPVDPRVLVDQTGIPSAEVARALGTWPGVFADDDGRIVGFWGLCLPATAHRMRVDGHDLHTWCAWDTLFLAPVLQRTVAVASRCPATGVEVSLTVDPGGVRCVDPAPTVVSFLRPGRERADDIITTFCRHVLFLASPDAGRRWLDGRPNGFLLGLDDAFQLGLRVVRSRFGAALDG
jgi:alkylmercury lyase